MRLTRRHFVAAAALVALATPAGIGVHWWDQPAEAPYLHLSRDEVRFLDALAEAVFPRGGDPEIGGGEAQVGRYVDALLTGMEANQRELLRVGLHAVDNLARAGHAVPFHELDTSGAQAQLTEWLTSPVGPLRGVVQSLYLFVGMAYVAHPQVAPVVRPWFGCGFA